jgi:hypothetical protein
VKFNFNQVLNTLEGPAFTDETGVKMTLGSAVIKVCSIPLKGDDENPMEKYKVGEIAIAIHKGLEIDAKQRDTAKSRVATAYGSPLLVFLINEALDHPLPSAANATPGAPAAAKKRN